MKYQLVLQFSADSIADFDRLVALETKLIEELGESATVDGHDFGWGKFNIFYPHGRAIYRFHASP